MNCSPRFRYHKINAAGSNRFAHRSGGVPCTPQADYWKAIEVNWENILSAKVSKIVTVNFYLQFLYDKQIDLRGRLKQTLGLGVIYALI